MNNTNSLQAYIERKLADLDNQRDMNDIISKGKFSFGMDSTTYGHLPAWKTLLQQKKKLVRQIWIDAFFTSVLAVGIATDIWDKFAASWLKTLAEMLLLSLIIMFVLMITTYFNLFLRFRQTDSVVRKLIYQDLLYQLKSDSEKQVSE
jgi:hypothetical protein